MRCQRELSQTRASLNIYTSDNHPKCQRTCGASAQSYVCWECSKIHITTVNCFPPESKNQKRLSNSFGLLNCQSNQTQIPPVPSLTIPHPTPTKHTHIHRELHGQRYTHTHTYFSLQVGLLQLQTCPFLPPCFCAQATASLESSPSSPLIQFLVMLQGPLKLRLGNHSIHKQ